MPVEADVRPRGPFSLRLSARGSVDGRSYRGGLFSALLAVDGGVERGIAAQRKDGSLRLRAESQEGLGRLRFVLALDDDHSEFLRRFADDPPWVHVDIAGVAWGMTRDYVGSGASGWGVRTLVELTRRAAG